MKNTSDVQEKWQEFVGSLQFVQIIFPLQNFQFDVHAPASMKIQPGAIRQFKPHCLIQAMPDGSRMLVAVVRTTATLIDGESRKDLASGNVVAGLMYSFKGEPPAKIPPELMDPLEKQVFMNGWPYIRQTIHDLFVRAGFHELPMLPLFLKPPTWTATKVPKEKAAAG